MARGSTSTPVDQSAAGKAVHGDEPRRRRARHKCQESHSEHQDGGVEDRLRQHMGHQVRPDVVGRCQGQQQNRDQR